MIPLMNTCKRCNITWDFPRQKTFLSPDRTLPTTSSGSKWSRKISTHLPNDSATEYRSCSDSILEDPTGGSRTPDWSFRGNMGSLPCPKNRRGRRSSPCTLTRCPRGTNFRRTPQADQRARVHGYSGIISLASG